VNIVVFIFVGILLGLIFSYAPIKQIVRIYRTPIYRIKNLPESGQVVVVGKADSKDTKSLLKRTNCALWEVVIQEKRITGGKGGSAQWFEIYRQMSNEPFEISDGTGSVQIVPVDAKLILHNDLQKTNGLLHPLPPRIKDTIEELGILTMVGFGIERPLRVYERSVGLGDEVYVTGEVKYENGTKIIKSSDKLPFIISDYKGHEILGALFNDVAVNVGIGIFLSVTVIRYLSLQPK
jgi:hypothetical protein